MRRNVLHRVRTLRDDEGGFTLIELLIVIVVLGVLAGIVVFGVGTFRQDAELAAEDADCKTVSVAAEAWNARNSGYPATVGALETAGYIKSVPDSMTAGTTITAGGEATGC